KNMSTDWMAEAKNKDRILLLVDALGMDVAKATEMAAKLANLSEEAFRAYAENTRRTLAEMWEAVPQKGKGGPPSEDEQERARASVVAYMDDVFGIEHEPDRDR